MWETLATRAAAVLDELGAGQAEHARALPAISATDALVRGRELLARERTRGAGR